MRLVVLFVLLIIKEFLLFILLDFRLDSNHSFDFGLSLSFGLILVIGIVQLIVGFL